MYRALSWCLAFLAVWAAASGNAVAQGHARGHVNSFDPEWDWSEHRRSLRFWINPAVDGCHLAEERDDDEVVTDPTAETEDDPTDGRFSLGDAARVAAEIWNSAPTGWSFIEVDDPADAHIVVVKEALGELVGSQVDTDLLGFHELLDRDDKDEVTKALVKFNEDVPLPDWGITPGQMTWDPIILMVHEFGHCMRLANQPGMIIDGGVGDVMNGLIALGAHRWNATSGLRPNRLRNPGPDDLVETVRSADLRRWERFALGATPLIFPLAVSGDDIETGLAVSNPSRNRLAGAVVYRLFSADPQDPVLSVGTQDLAARGLGTGLDADGLVPPGGTHAVLVRELLDAGGRAGRDFNGFVAAACDFNQAEGANFIGNRTFDRISQGYPATPLQRTTASRLFFPLNVAAGDVQSGLSVSNASAVDPLGAEEGTVRFRLQSVGGGVVSTFEVDSEDLAAQGVGQGLSPSGIIAPGGTYSVLLRELAIAAGAPRDFTGIVIADAEFSGAQGVNFISNSSFDGFAQGYRAVQVEACSQFDQRVLFPFSAAARGVLDTGIGVANASSEIGRPTSGRVEYALYPQDTSQAPVRISSRDLSRLGVGTGAGPGGDVAPGALHSVLLSELLEAAGVLADFVGQIVAECEFPAPVGVNFVADSSFDRLAQGYAGISVDRAQLPSQRQGLAFNVSSEQLETGIGVANIAQTTAGESAGPVRFRLIPSTEPAARRVVDSAELARRDLGAGMDETGSIPPGGILTVLNRDLARAAGIAGSFTGRIEVEADFPMRAVSFIGDRDFREMSQGYPSVAPPPPDSPGFVDPCQPCVAEDSSQDLFRHFSGIPSVSPGSFADIRRADVRVEGDETSRLLLEIEIHGPIPTLPDASFASWHFIVDLDGRATTGHPGNQRPVGVFPELGVDLWTDLIFDGASFRAFLFEGAFGVANLVPTPGLLEASLDETRTVVRMQLPLGGLSADTPLPDPGRLRWVAVTNFCSTEEECLDPPSDFFPDWRYTPEPRQLTSRAARSDTDSRSRRAPAQTRRRKALLIGVSDDITNAGNDVDLVRGVLEDQWGFTQDDIQSLVDAAATEAAILKALEELAECDDEENVIFVFFAGHGVVGDQNEHAVETGDGKLLTATEFGEALAKFDNANLVVAVDSCFAQGTLFGLEELPDNAILGYSAGSQKEAHGSFLGHHWTKAVFQDGFQEDEDTGRPTADRDGDRLVSVEEAFRYGFRVLFRSQRAGLYDGDPENDLQLGP